MELEHWWPWYRKIVETFGFIEEEDQKATFMLDRLLMRRTLNLKTLREKVKRKIVIVFGAGPSLVQDLKTAVEMGFHKRCVTASADGSTTALLSEGITPDLVITDLDGNVRDIVEAHNLGSVVVVHAHGDNIEGLQTYVPMFKGRLVGTTQVRPTARVHNFGGFTDGDRCVFLSEEFGAKKIALMGMDFGNRVGIYSKPNLKSNYEASPAKYRKLSIAKQLLEWYTTWAKAELINLTSSGEEIEGARKVRQQEFLNLCF